MSASPTTGVRLSSVDVLSRTTNLAPYTPTLNSPEDQKKVETLTPVLMATGTDPDGNDPLSYYFEVTSSSDFSFANPIGNSGWLPTTRTFSVPPEWTRKSATFYWRAKVRDASNAESPWSNPRRFVVEVVNKGVEKFWPMWKHGPIAVNQANGNLVLGLPGPSYPTAVGTVGAALTFNSLDSKDRGLGAGWTLGAGDEVSGSAPIKLVDHHYVTGDDHYEGIELFWPNGDSTVYPNIDDSNEYGFRRGDNAQLVKSTSGVVTYNDGTTIYTFSAIDTATGVATVSTVERVDTDKDGFKLSFTYSGVNPPRVTEIKESLNPNRKLTFTWWALNPSGCASAIVCISGPDGVTWRYVGTATTSGKVASVVRDPGNGNPARTVATVTYDGNNRLWKIQNANDLDPTHASPGYSGSHSLQITYDGSGRALQVSDGPISGSTSTWSFGYVPGNVSLTATRASHSVGSGVRTAAGYTTVTPPRQQGTGNSARVYYDDFGHPMETRDLLGNISMAQFDAEDKLLWSEDAEGDPTDLTWDELNDLKLSLAEPDPDGPGPSGRPTTTSRYDETQIGTSSTPGAALQGLQAYYFANQTLSGRPAAIQTDGAINYDWGALGGPSALATACAGGTACVNNFSIRWSGNLIVPASGAYTFRAVGNDGVRLTVDSLHVIDAWFDGDKDKYSQPIQLGAGAHKFTFDYYELANYASVRLDWACATCVPAVTPATIPVSAFRPVWGNPTSKVAPSGRLAFSHFADPAKGHPDYTLVKDGSTNVITSFTYDSYSRVTQKVMPKGNASRTIDASGNLQGSPNTTYATSYSYYGPTEAATPPATCGGGSTNQAGLPKSTQPNGIAAATFVYDSAGRPVATTNGAGTTCVSYNVDGFVASSKSPNESQATTYAYDPAGAQRTATDATGTVTNDFDEAGRVKRAVDSFGAEATFAYDADGNRTQRIAAVGALASNPNYTTNYIYNLNDQLTDMTDPAGRAYKFYYCACGRLKAIQYPNGTFSWSDDNAAGWITNVYNRHGNLGSTLPSSVPADSLGSPIADYTYTYDTDGRKTQEIRSGGGLTTETTGYQYDDLGRLYQVTLPGAITRTYNFDLDSNRTSIVENGSTVSTYTYNPAVTAGVDQLTSVTTGGTTTNYAYTSDGQVSARGGDTITWDGRGRHNGGTFLGGAVALSYSFDATGFRRQRARTIVATPTNVITIRYLLGGFFETDPAGVISLTGIDGPAGDLAHYSGAPTTSSTVKFKYYNAHGDIVAEADIGGARTAAMTYDPFGALRSGPGPQTPAAERWLGSADKKLDTLSNLVEMGARPYDPVTGRFLSVDPVDGGSLNAYEYAGQDPVNRVDLAGRQPGVLTLYRGGEGCPPFVLAKYNAADAVMLIFVPHEDPDDVDRVVGFVQFGRNGRGKRGRFGPRPLGWEEERVGPDGPGVLAAFAVTSRQGIPGNPPFVTAIVNVTLDDGTFCQYRGLARVEPAPTPGDPV